MQKRKFSKINIKREIDLVIEAINANKIETVKKHLKQIDLFLSDEIGNQAESPEFKSKAITISEFCILHNIKPQNVIGMLERLILITEELGDERNWAKANLLLGRTYVTQNRPHETLFYLGRGKEKAEELGDREILTYAALFIGLYYYYRGYLNKSAMYLRPYVAQLALGFDNHMLAYEAPLVLTWCDINRRDFSRAVGTMEFYRQLALKRQDYFTAAHSRAMLGIVLWVSGRKKEAIYHLDGAQTDAVSADNILAYLVSLLNLSCIYFGEKNVDKGLPLFQEMLKLFKSRGLAPYIFHPVFLESYFKADEIGCELPNEWRFDALFERIMNEPNIDLQGVALRLRAIKSIRAKKDEELIFKDLQQSEALLKKCEDSFQLGKTRIEIVRFYLRNNDHTKARSLAHEVYQEMLGYQEIVFPDDLEFLLKTTKKDQTSPEISLEPILRILEESISIFDKINMDLFLSTLSRFFRAECSGIFRFSKEKVKLPDLKVARNLSNSIVYDKKFQRRMNLIVACYQTKKPILVRSKKIGDQLKERKTLNVICMPIFQGMEVKEILYFENSYFTNCFDFVSKSMLKTLSYNLSDMLEKQGTSVINHADPSTSVSNKTVAGLKVLPEFPGSNIVMQDPKTVKLFDKARSFSQSDAPILILGETGVGKEILAQWIHSQSAQNKKPFVIVDLTTIPENLMDSELFGHEKGAFTGAHQQKIGQVELSKGGTLFLDEIGEVPISLQVKLLRLLEQKTFTRVGGTTLYRINFRLLAATNRNLSEEVKKGRFRKDLFYRINTLELTIPPLRERKGDIEALAKHFLDNYARKYNKKLPVLTDEQLTRIKNYGWPGNVRELKNVIERTVLISDDIGLNMDLLDRQEFSPAESIFSNFPTMDELQRRYIQFILNHNGGKISGIGGATDILSMNRSTLRARMRKLGIHWPNHI